MAKYELDERQVKALFEILGETQILYKNAKILDGIVKSLSNPIEE